MVGVLILVDHDVPEASTVMLGDLREGLQHRDRLADQVVEVERVGGPQPALVLGVDGGHRARQVVGVVGQVGHRLLRVDQLVLQVGDGVGQQPRRIPLDVEAHVLSDHLQQTSGIVGVVEGEVGVEARDQRRLIAQNPHAGRVERRHPRVAGARAHQRNHPLAHLGGGLVGEGDGQNLTGADVARGQKVCDAPGQHGRLAGARAGDDEQRRALVQHRLTLLRVQAIQELISVGNLPSIGRIHTHICLQTYRRSATPLRRNASKWHTHFVLNMQRRFFYGYRPAVPVA